MYLFILITYLQNLFTRPSCDLKIHTPSTLRYVIQTKVNSTRATPTRSTHSSKQGHSQSFVSYLFVSLTRNSYHSSEQIVFCRAVSISFKFLFTTSCAVLNFYSQLLIIPHNLLVLLVANFTMKSYYMACKCF